MDENTPRFSLLHGEGAGMPLAAAAGDVAGGADLAGYSAVTQTATVVAYHLLRLGAVDRPSLEVELAELGGSEDEAAVYRAPSDGLKAWLDSRRAGDPAAWAEATLEPASRIGPIGVWYRREPDLLVRAAITSARITHVDARAVTAAVAVAGAVAGSCFAQAGRDLVLATAEVATLALAPLEAERYRFAAVDRASEIPEALRAVVSLVDAPLDEIEEAVSEQFDDDLLRDLCAAIVMGARASDEGFRLIEAGARAGGSVTGAVVGSMVGARTGLRRWPWIVPNDTWFAELGRRLVSRHAEVRDLPVPYAVEERLLPEMARRLRPG